MNTACLVLRNRASSAFYSEVFQGNIERLYAGGAVFQQRGFAVTSFYFKVHSYENPAGIAYFIAA